MKIEELEKLNSEVIEEARKFSNLYAQIFEIMRDHGLRASETSPEKWEKVEGTENTFIVNTAKRGDKRIIKIDSQKNDFLTYITGGKIDITVNYRRLYRIYTQSIKNVYYASEKKMIKTHSFRHEKMIKEKNKGLTVNEISNYFGLKKAETVEKYTSNNHLIKSYRK